MTKKLQLFADLIPGNATNVLYLLNHVVQGIFIKPGGNSDRFLIFPNDFQMTPLATLGIHREVQPN